MACMCKREKGADCNSFQLKMSHGIESRQRWKRKTSTDDEPENSALKSPREKPLHD
jgi:hypothetical protein